MIVDASVAFKWLIDETGSEQAVRWSDEEWLVAPTLMRAEVGNALITKVVRGEISAETASVAFGAVGQFVAEWADAAGLDDDAFAIASELRHPIYDCYYLALGQQRHISVLTADRRLIARCAGSRFAERLVTL